MKIVLVIDQFDDANNGTTISARRFAQALKNHGNEVRVIATGKPADYKYAVRQMRFFPVVEHLITSQGMRLAIPNRHVFEKAAAWADVVHFMMPSPLGIMGLVANSVGSEGLSALLGYMKLLAVLISAYATVALVINPLLVFTRIHRNPYPLVLTTLKESGIYAFFTRSSAANIPVNLSLCCRLGLDPDMYTISIPLGAAVNTAGASVTISVLSLAAAYTLGIHVDIPTALLLCLVATIGACGSSGVAGGSLLLIPVACASFGINNDIAMQVVGVGFIISVLEDACETALNSSSDVLFTATAEFEKRRKEGTLKSGDMELRRG